MEYVNTIVAYVTNFFTPNVITTVLVIAALIVIAEKIRKVAVYAIVAAAGVFAYQYLV